MFLLLAIALLSTLSNADENMKEFSNEIDVELARLSYEDTESITSSGSLDRRTLFSSRRRRRRRKIEIIPNTEQTFIEAVGAELEKFGEGFVNTITGRLSTSQQNVLRKLYHIRHMNCKDDCENGFHHFATSDHGCCKHPFSCGGNRKWCRKKKTFSEVGRRELGEDEPEAEVGIFDTFKDELALMKSLNGLSDSETEEFVASFDEDELAQAPDMERMSADEEQEVADEKREWIQVHNNMEEMSAEEQEEKVGEILKVLEKKFWRRSDIKV